MKKFILVMILPLIFLVGCDDVFPYVRYAHSYWSFESNCRNIKVKDGYELNQGFSYEWVETEDGYDLVLHFVKESESNAE